MWVGTAGAWNIGWKAPLQGANPLPAKSPASNLLIHKSANYILAGSRASRLIIGSFPPVQIAMAPGLCVVCLNFGNCKRCACGAGWYCSHACQIHDWAGSEEPHRDVCPLQVFKDVCDSHDIPNQVRRLILSYTAMLRHGRDV